MNQPQRIFIMGQSGAGKGVLAQALALKLGWKFIDADFGMAPSIGLSLREILGTEGEKSFQYCLSKILKNQLSQKNIVVATDDCIISHETSRQLLVNEYSVYLKVSIATQLQRISHNRPLLPTQDFKTFLEKLHHERDSLFEQTAKLTISTDNDAIDEHVDMVIKALSKNP